MVDARRDFMGRHRLLTQKQQKSRDVEAFDGGGEIHLKGLLDGLAQ